MFPHERVGRCYSGYHIEVLIEHNGVTGIYVAQKNNEYRILKIALTQEASAILLHEKSILEKIQHTSIVTFFESIEVESLPALVLYRYIRGPLSRYVGQLSISDVSMIFEELSSVIHFLYEQSIVHRDIKPQNIVLDDCGRPVLIDFGVAAHIHVQEDFFVGTAEYASLEVLKGEKSSLKSELYSVACVIYTLVHGASPRASNTSKREHGLSEEGNERLNQMLYDDLIVQELHEVGCINNIQEKLLPDEVVREKKSYGKILVGGGGIFFLFIFILFDCFYL